MDYKKFNDYEILYMIKENDEYSRNLIFNKYLPIVKNIASKYYNMLVYLLFDSKILTELLNSYGL